MSLQKGVAIGEGSENNDTRAPISLENGSMKLEVVDNFN